MKDVYSSAHYIHCYVHQLNLIMQQATSHIPKISALFSDLVDLLHFSPGLLRELRSWIKWWHTDFLALPQHDGTFTVVL